MNASNSRVSTAVRSVSAEIAQLGRVTQIPGQLTRAGVIDGPGQADHQRRVSVPARLAPQCRAREDRVPAGLGDRACRVITEVTADDIGVQRAQLDSRRRPKGRLRHHALA